MISSVRDSCTDIEKVSTCISHNENSFLNTPDNFVGGKISKFLVNWCQLSSDKWLLDIIKGYRIEFDEYPLQFSIPNQLLFNSEETEIINAEIEKFLNKQIIVPVSDTEGQYISNIFIRPKKDGNFRVILNLKQLNNTIEHHHFKMETLKSALQCITANCWFGSVDLKDAYYSISVDRRDRKFLRFYWIDQLYEFTCLPNGLTTAPRIFTKVLKVVFSHLRKIGHTNIAYIDDSLLISKSYTECEVNIHDTVQLLDHLGFTIHPVKSVLKPTQTITFLGFVLNSVSMCIRLTSEKALLIKDMCLKLIKSREITIRDFAKIIGMLVAAEPGVDYGFLYIKSLEIEKDEQLKLNTGNFDVKILLSSEAVSMLKWWIDHVESSFKPLRREEPTMILKSDSSKTGWGGLVENSSLNTRGFWSYEEQKLHKNYLELKAAFLTIKCFCATKTNLHVKIFLDNMVAVSYIDKMGGHIKALNTLTRELWEWCIRRNIWLSAANLPGVSNVHADKLSRATNFDLEWMLNIKVFEKLDSIYGPHELDLFASRINHQLPRYVSFLPDPNAEAVDAFSVSWTNINCYAFPPFSLIGRVIQKMVKDKADVTLIAPLWKTQHWFPEVLQHISQDSYLIPHSRHQRLLIQPTNPEMKHPLKKLTLAVFRLSGNLSKVQDFQNKQQTLLFPHGEQLLRNSIGHISHDGVHFVVKDRLIFLNQLKWI